ncbi:hypothetical protein I315_02966 [Cryptococcus gattii Ru294]|nr:hypothetical protein I315_02966 [Cryptococcus gattii Ru294]
MSPLESLSQQIHATLLSPPAKFLLTSKRAVDDQWWRLRLFWNGGGDSKAGVRVWTADINLEEVSATEEVLAAAIETGMLHVDCGRRSVNLSTLDELSLHVLIQPKPIITYLTLGNVEDYVGQLIEVNYKVCTSFVSKSKYLKAVDVNVMCGMTDATLFFCIATVKTCGP